ncbi:MAG: PDZ domain-containing protein [Rudaea sp.]|uniref:PDZ domain-containing protein n=1 Tax=Rudaea sp. TaxID=2136325 RepID=UPI0039E4630D
MKRNVYTFTLIAAALALGANPARAANSPAGTAADAKIDAEQARRELDRMRTEMRELSKKMAEISAELGDVGPSAYGWRYLGDPDRGMIGVVLGQEPKGIRVSAVTPGGPADKAGLRDGDLIVSVRGEGIDKDAAGNVAAANRALRNLKVGEEVTLTVQRSGKNLDMKIKAERREPFNFAFSFDGLDGIDAEKIRAEVDQAARGAQMSREQVAQMREQVREATRIAAEQGRAAAEQGRTAAEQGRQAAEEARLAARRIRYSTPWWGLNLSSLNPDLGSYFGADHGALVLSADAEFAKTLKPGDVLLAIDGRKIERPEDAMRQLRDGKAGREVKVEVLRQRKMLALSLKAPEFESPFVPMPPPLPPLAPMAPTAPTPPAAPSSPPQQASPAPPAPPSQE